ncbi:MAG: cell division protein ZipA [Pseudomonas sp.]
MEIGLREWLILIGVIVIASILFDGWRRVRGGKGKLKFRLDRSFSNPADDDDDPALPGPPRVLPRDQEPHLGEENLSALSARELNRRRNNRGESHHAEPALGADEELPILSESLDDEWPAERVSAPRPEAKALPAVEDVLVMSVIARDQQGFTGPALLQNILESGLRFGDMDIFHRHESMSGKGEVLFSMANAVKPGTFDLDDIDHFSTRAVSFFLSLPGPRYPKQAFDVMVAAARKLAHELNGELKDDQRSAITAQTIEHYRQRIVEFERKQLTRKH